MEEVEVVAGVRRRCRHPSGCCAAHAAEAGDSSAPPPPSNKPLPSAPSPPPSKPAAEDGPDGRWEKGDLLPYKWVVYTALEGAVRAGDDSWRSMWKKGDPVPAAGITDGPAPCDGDASNKQVREAYFPLALADKALQEIKLETAEASVAADKTHILNAMIGEKDFDKELPEHHPKFDELNEMLRACFAAGSFRRAVEAADADMLRRFCDALSKGRMRELSLDFKGCARFTPDVAGQLGAAPGQLKVTEKLTLGFDDERDVLMAALAAALREGAAPKLKLIKSDSQLK